MGTLQMSLFLLFGSLFDLFNLNVEFFGALGLGHLDEAWLQLELDLVLDFAHCSKLEVCCRFDSSALHISLLFHDALVLSLNLSFEINLSAHASLFLALLFGFFEKSFLFLSLHTL